VKQSSSFSRKHQIYLSRSVRQTVRLTTEFVDWCRNVCTLYKPLSAIPAAVTSDLKQRLVNTWENISQNVIDEAVGQRRKRLRASMKAKWHHFEHLLNWNLLFSEPTLHNRFFSEPPTVYRGKHVFSRHFHRSYLKANKVSKSEGTRKVKYAYHFWKCADGADRKLSINWPMLVETTASQSWRVFWDTMYNLFVC